MSDAGTNDGLVRGLQLDGVEPIFDTFDVDDVDYVPAATHWPDIAAAEVPEHWEELRAWVERLQGRFAHLDHHVIPRCWWRHNKHVEALSAVRDHELVSFAETAPATAPVDWSRAMRDITALLRAWTSELSCGVEHKDSLVSPTAPSEAAWDEFVQADVERRERSRARPADLDDSV